LATSGDTHLGGDDWDKAVADWIHAQIQIETGANLTDKMAQQRFIDAAEKAKIELSRAYQTTISLPFIGTGSNGPISGKARSPARNSRISPAICSNAANPDGESHGRCQAFSYNDLGDILMIGGSIRMPAVQDLVKKVSGHAINLSVNPDEAVSIGAAIQGGVIAGEVKDVVFSTSPRSPSALKPSAAS
jgi:L1 cell adhesion molecule like protein